MYKRMTYLRIMKQLAGMEGVNVDQWSCVSIPQRDNESWREARDLAHAAADKLNAVFSAGVYWVATSFDINMIPCGYFLKVAMHQDAKNPELTGFADPMHY